MKDLKYQSFGPLIDLIIQELENLQLSSKKVMRSESINHAQEIVTALRKPSIFDRNQSSRANDTASEVSRKDFIVSSNPSEPSMVNSTNRNVGLESTSFGMFSLPSSPLPQHNSQDTANFSRIDPRLPGYNGSGNYTATENISDSRFDGLMPTQQFENNNILPGSSRHDMNMLTQQSENNNIPPGFSSHGMNMLTQQFENNSIPPGFSPHGMNMLTQQFENNNIPPGFSPHGTNMLTQQFENNSIPPESSLHGINMPTQFDSMPYPHSLSSPISVQGSYPQSLANPNLYSHTPSNGRQFQLSPGSFETSSLDSTRDTLTGPWLRNNSAYHDQFPMDDGSNEE